MTARPSLLTAREVGSRSEAVNEFTLGQDRKLIGERERERGRGGRKGRGDRERDERKRYHTETAVFHSKNMYLISSNRGLPQITAGFV